MASQRYGAGSDSSYGARRDAKPSAAGAEYMRYRRIEPPQPSGFTYDFFGSRSQHLHEREHRLRSLMADLNDLRDAYEEQESALASTRNELKSCQAQLDSVQHFISTADTHADQDIVQKLQELNEEVYQLSMTMADRVVEGFVRRDAAARQTKENVSVEKTVLTAIGQTMVDHLAVVEGDEDVALFLQIALQGYLCYFLYQIIPMWSTDNRLNTLISGTYQRLRKAETQSISGHWRSLTRTYIQPTLASEPKALVQSAVTMLSNIVLATGLSPPEGDTVSKLSSEFSEGIESIVFHAGKFGDMVAGMISGNFEVFAIPPGVTFSRTFMVDINGDGSAPQGVLCASRVGLKKQVGERSMILTEAHVVLESFLG